MAKRRQGRTFFQQLVARRTLSFPTSRLEGCSPCKRCTVECPFGAIDEDEMRCRRYGTCMGACSVRVVLFENYSVNTVGSQIKYMEVPDEFSGKPRFLVLACENDAYPRHARHRRVRLTHRSRPQEPAHPAHFQDLLAETPKHATKTGRVNEVKLTQSLYFKDGIGSGIKKAMEMQSVALGLVKAKRLNPLEAIGISHKCKDIKGIHAMLAKANELEAQHKADKSKA